MSNYYSNQDHAQQLRPGSLPQGAQSGQQAQQVSSVQQQYGQPAQQHQYQQPSQQYGQHTGQQYAQYPAQQIHQPALQQHNEQPGWQYGQQQYLQQYAQPPSHHHAQQYATQSGQQQMQPYCYTAQPMQQQQGQQQQTTTTSTTTSTSNNQYHGMHQQALDKQAFVQQQPTNAYKALMRPPPQPGQQKIQNDISQVLKAAADSKKLPPALQCKTTRRNDTSTSTTTKTVTTSRTERYKGERAGGVERRKAEAKGEKAVKRFEEIVATFLEVFVPACPAERWYCMEDGYICSDGYHLVYHKDIDIAVQHLGHVPTVLTTNTWESASAQMSGQATGEHPPPVDFWQPMHKAHKDFVTLSVAKGCTVAAGRTGVACDECLRGLEVEGLDKGDERLRMDGFVPEMNLTRQLQKRLGLRH